MKREDRELYFSAHSAARRFLKNGGTVERLQTIFEQVVHEMPREDQQCVAHEGLVKNVRSRHPNEDGEARLVVPHGRLTCAEPSSPHRDGAGQSELAGEGPMANARTVREPTARQRRIALEIHHRAALTIIDTYIIRDGRAIGDVRIGEVERLRAANAMEAYIFRQIQKHAVADSNALIRDVIKPEEFQRMQQRAAEYADVA